MAVDPTPPTATYRRRRNTELVLILVAQSIGLAGLVLTYLFRDNALPPHLGLVAALWYGLGVLASLAVRWRAPYADPILLPATFALLGLGLAELHRLSLGIEDLDLTAQFIAVGLGLAGFVAVVIWLRDLRRLKSFPYLLSLLSLALLLLPLVPGLGVEINGSQIWIRLAGFSIQPAEVAKLVLAASFAAYLTEQRDLLSLAGRRVLGLRLTRVRDIGPILVMWGVGLVIMVKQNDLGTSLLFFGLFVMMLYVATGQLRWIVLAGGLAAVGGVAAWRLFDHVQRRVTYWLHPFDLPDDATQIISAQYGLASGGLFGTGWGLGRPGLTPFSFNDMIGTSLGEEIGLVGLMGIILLYALIAFRGLSAALRAHDPFTKLLAAGLSFGFLLQTFAIIGGATRLLPLTGLTSPFLSQGGSSMIANWLLIGLLVAISHEVRRPVEAVAVDLADERTMTLSARQLRQVAMGPVRPLLDFPEAQVREADEAVTVAVGADSAATVAVPPADPIAAAVWPAEPATADVYRNETAFTDAPGQTTPADVHPLDAFPHQTAPTDVHLDDTAPVDPPPNETPADGHLEEAAAGAPWPDQKQRDTGTVPCHTDEAPTAEVPR
jgi:cell division protein FtsW (lipid II flippase)